MVYVVYDEQTCKVNKTAFADAALVPIGSTFIAVDDEAWNAAQGKIMRVENGTFVCSDPPPTAADYDAAMEAHLRAEREARGYTLREPSDYAGSGVHRWAQDAADWIAHRDAVMLYALEVMNHYAATGEAPTLEEFRESLPRIEWTDTKD